MVVGASVHLTVGLFLLSLCWFQAPREVVSLFIWELKKKNKVFVSLYPKLWSKYFVYFLLHFAVKEV